MGKAVFVTFQGDDLRQGAFCERHFGPAFVKELPVGYFSPETDARKQWRAARLAKKADGLYAVNPDLMYLLPESAKFMCYPHLDPREWAAVAPATHDGRGATGDARPTHRA